MTRKARQTGECFGLLPIYGGFSLFMQPKDERDRASILSKTINSSTKLRLFAWSARPSKQASALGHVPTYRSAPFCTMETKEQSDRVRRILSKQSSPLRLGVDSKVRQIAEQFYVTRKHASALRFLPGYRNHSNDQLGRVARSLFKPTVARNSWFWGEGRRPQRPLPPR